MLGKHGVFIVPTSTICSDQTVSRRSNQAIYYEVGSTKDQLGRSRNMHNRRATPGIGAGRHRSLWREKTPRQPTKTLPRGETKHCRDRDRQTLEDDR
ncbi:hypothetical protein NDU88_005075 [Pleurodeles waltl]|uniref:Uncharacterized protein n=1 Tax=Pleurodeles waltl TaxID=8319 RepID=A0AAV7UH47_PLEWA|nr:hypothetical protein NDU88_005075 [Pleurodeles waltl]